MRLIVPGVDVSVVKEVVPPLPNPSGIVGLVGVTDRGPSAGARVTSWKEFVDVFGEASTYSLPEARAVLENGAFALVVVPVGGATQASALLQVPGSSPAAVTVRARAPGSWANGRLGVEVLNERVGLFDLRIGFGAVREVLRNLQVSDPAAPGYLPTAVNAESRLVVIGAPRDPATLTLPSGPQALDTSTSLTLNNNAAPPAPLLRLDWISADPGTVELLLESGGLTLVVRVGSDERERHTALDLDPDAEPGDASRYIVTALELSDYVRAVDLLPALSGDGATASVTLAGGVAPGSAEYRSALERLETEGDVDLVLASLQDYAALEASTPTHRIVHAAVATHCEQMSAQARNRIGFGGVGPGWSATAVVDEAVHFNSDRFVLVAPAGIVGSVVGRVAQLDYFSSPTFKTLAGVARLERDYLRSELERLLQARVLPVDLHRQLGYLVVRGIATTGEQINVTRIADHAVRGVRAIADLFIGRLNNQLGRLALRQKVVELFQEMERAGAIVPSVDGIEPAFKVDVYSSPADFAQGVVRVDIAVRPVRAIDFVHATVLVQI